MKYFLSLIILVNFALGFDSVEVLNPEIHMNKSGWFKSDQPLSAEEAYHAIKDGKYASFTKKAQSFGFRTAEHWFVFDITVEQTQTPFFIDSRDALAESCELYVFQDDKLIRKETSGYNILLPNRPIEQFPIRFSLNSTSTQTTYLIKTISPYPIYASYAFGEQNKLDKTWHIRYFIFVFSCGIFVSMLLYNLFLYLVIKDKAYIFYCIYIVGFFMISMFAGGYVVLFLPILTPFSPLIIFLLLQIEFIGLFFFTNYFLHLKETFPLLARIIRYFFYATIIAGFTVLLAPKIQIISMIFMNIFYFLLIYAGVRSYLSGFKPALYYLIATGFALILVFAYSFMNQGLLFSFNIWSYHFMTFGVMWDMILLSFALAYRIKILRDENTQKERLIMLQSRQKNIGELTGNIAHQWKHPLSKLGSILSHLEAKLKYSTIQKSEMLDSVIQSNGILQYLSQTINTFQELFQNRQTSTLFNVNEQVVKCINFVKEALSDNNITIEYTSKYSPTLKGDEKQFFQALLNIILNAKDAIIAKERLNGLITITLNVEQKFWTLAIKDNGGGITIEPIDKIFDLYITDKNHGIGMGLFITKNIIENSLGGKLLAKNENDGAVFTILFTKI